MFDNRCPFIADLSPLTVTCVIINIIRLFIFYYFYLLVHGFSSYIVSRNCLAPQYPSHQTPNFKNLKTWDLTQKHTVIQTKVTIWVNSILLKLYFAKIGTSWRNNESSVHVSKWYVSKWYLSDGCFLVYLVGIFNFPTRGCLLFPDLLIRSFTRWRNVPNSYFWSTTWYS